jgi:hypothetical protein
MMQTFDDVKKSVHFGARSRLDWIEPDGAPIGRLFRTMAIFTRASAAIFAATLR